MIDKNNSTIDWDEITKSSKGARTMDQKPCGNVISEDDDSIVISEGIINTHEFTVPKSKVDYYDGSEIHLNILYDMLSIFEVKQSTSNSRHI